MDSLIIAAFLFPIAVAVWKLVELRRGKPGHLDLAFVFTELGRLFRQLFGNVSELALYALFVLIAVAAWAISLAAFGPRLSIVALMIGTGFFVLFVLKPPPKAR